MHLGDSSSGKPGVDPRDGSWWRELSRYQWFVFVVASLGWLFDTMDQQLFNLARNPAIIRLLGTTPGDPATSGQVAAHSGCLGVIRNFSDHAPHWSSDGG